MSTASNTPRPAGFSHPRLSRHWVPREQRMSAMLRVGRSYDDNLSIDENLRKAQMDEPVRLLPAPIEMPDGSFVKTKNQHIVITSPSDKPGGHPKVSSLGVVAGKWKPLQMPEFIRTFEFLFEKYPPHALINVGGGRQQGLLLRPETLPKLTKLKEEIEIGYVLLNDYSGKGSISIRPVTMRLVCTNGMTAMHLDKQAVLRIPHTERGLIEMSQRAKILQDLVTEPGEVAKTYEILCNKRLTPDAMVAMVNQVHALPKKPAILLRPEKLSSETLQAEKAKFEATLQRIRDQRQVVHALHEYENDTAVSTLRGTAWLGWQALVEESDYNHHGGQPATTVPMFLGASATEQQKAFKLLLEA